MKRKIAAILAADIAGYSRLVAEDEEETLRRLETYRAVVSDFIGRFGGRVFNTAGDAMLAEFQSAVDAVRCAIDVQESLRTRNLAYTSTRQMSFRIGITIGDVVERDGDLLGDGVNIASRLECIAPPGGICISRSVYEAVANKISLRFSDVGEQQLKNISERVHAYTVALDQRGTSGKGPPQISASLRRVGGGLAIVTIAAVAATAFVLSRSGAPVESPAQSIAPKPGAGEQVAAARDSGGAESPSAARPNGREGESARSESADRATGAGAKSPDASAPTGEAKSDSRTDAAPRAVAAGTSPLDRVQQAVPGKNMGAPDQAAEAGETCSKYLPSIGRTVQAPCEDVKKPEPAEGVQAPEHACDRLAGEAVIALELIQADQAVPVCRDAVRRYPQTQRFQFQLARALDSSTTYEEALQLYRPLAQAGHPRATSNLGRMYMLGHGVAKDEVEAVRLFRQAADKGNALAMNNLGWMYRDGRGVAKDEAEAVRLFRQAAEKANALAMANLGWMYALGRGLPKDEAEAIRWFRKGAEAGSTASMNGLGRMYAEGRGVAKDEVEAVRWYRKGVEAGDPASMNGLGLMYAEGRGVAKDEAEAARLFRQAAEKGDAPAMHNLGWMYRDGRGVAKDDAEAVRWYRKGADAGAADSMTGLGSMYADGRGVTQDEAEAVRLFRQAAEKGTARAMRNLGWMYALGRGVTKDEAEAGRWIFLAIKNGDEAAIEDLTANSGVLSPALRDDVQQRLRDAGLDYSPR